MKVVFRYFAVLIFVTGFTQALAQQCTINGPVQVCAGESAIFSADQPVLWSVDGMQVGNGEMMTLNYPFPNPFPLDSQSFTISAITVDGMFTCSEVVTVLASPEIKLVRDRKCPNGNEPEFLYVDFCLCSAETEVFTAILSSSIPAEEIESIMVEWGDGDVSIYNSSDIGQEIEHEYEMFGLFDIEITLIGNFPVACSVFNYEIFHGTNPFGDLQVEGNIPTGCNLSVTYEILNAENNTDGTLYKIFIVNDVTEEEFLWADFDQSEIAQYETFTINFGELDEISSCFGSSATPFSVLVYITNPCDYIDPEKGPVRPILPPVAAFSTNPLSACVGETVQFVNESGGGFLVNNFTCSGELIGNWTVSSLNYEVESGDINIVDDIGISFNQPGEYIVGLTVMYNDGGNNNCSSDFFSDTITILPNGEIAIVDADLFNNESLCTSSFPIDFVAESDLENGFMWTLNGNDVGNNDTLSLDFSDDDAGMYTLMLDNSSACNVLPQAISFELLANSPIFVIQESLTSCDSLTFIFDDVFEVYGNFDSAVITINGEPYNYPDELDNIDAITSPASGEIILTVTNECVGTVADTIPYNIESGENIEIDPTLDTNVCISDGGILNLNDYITPNEGIDWISGAINGIFDISAATIGENHIIFFYGCANAVDTITIIADADIMIADTIVCGSPIDLTPDDFPYTGTCSCNCNAIIDTIDCIFDPDSVSAGTYTVTFTADDPNFCGSDEATTLVTVEALSINVNASTQDTCVGEPIIFEVITNSTDISVSWDFGDGNSSQENPFTHQYNSAGAYVATAMVSSTLSDCIAMDTIEITINTTPILDDYEFEVIADCNGSLIQVTLTDTLPNTTYTFEISDGTSVELTGGTGSIFIKGEIEEIETIGTLTAKNKCGTSDEVSETITIPPIFNANFDVIGLDNDTNTFCNTDTISFGNISTGPIDSFVVYYDSWTNFSIDEFEPQIYTNLSDTIAQHRVTLVIFSDICGTDTFEVILDILPVETKALFNVNDIIFCSGETLIVNNLSTPGSISFFSINNVTSEQSFPVGDTIIVDNLPAGDYLITVTAEGCGVDTMTMPISVSDILISQIEYPSVLCAGTPAQFGIDTTGITDMLWESSDGQVSNNISPDFIYENPGNYTVTLSGMSEGSCPVMGMANIMVLPAPTITINPSTYNVCIDDTISFEAVSDANNIIWTFSNGYTATGDIAEVPVGTSEILQAMAIVTNDEGCTNQDSVDIMVNGDLEVYAGEDITISQGESTILEAISNETVNFTWMPDESLSCINCSMPTASPNDSTLYIVTAKNGMRCEASDSVWVFVTDDHNVFIPNIFSPNGDEVNDVFVIHGGVGVENIKTFRVFDRWGDLVYEAENISTDDKEQGWNGTFRGRKMNPGVYVYYIELNLINDDEPVLYRGDVTLVR